MFIFKIFKNRNFILALSFVLGLTIGDKIGTWIKHLTIPALAIIMIVSMLEFSFGTMKDIKSVIKPAIYSIICTYFIFGFIVLILSRVFVKDSELWKGMVLLAVAPPGVAIPPFARIIGGDEKNTVIGLIFSYIAVLAIIPLAGIALIGANIFEPIKLTIFFLEIIIGPIIIAQIIRKFKAEKYILKYRGPIINWGLFLIIFITIALNRKIFFTDLKSVGIISMISVLTIFGLWFLVNIFLKKSRIRNEDIKNMALFATIKNSSFSAATALAFFGDKASLPSAIFSIFVVIHLIFLSMSAKSKTK